MKLFALEPNVIEELLHFKQRTMDIIPQHDLIFHRKPFIGLNDIVLLKY